MAIVTIFALISWYLIPANSWLPSQRIQEVIDAPSSGPHHHAETVTVSPEELK